MEANPLLALKELGQHVWLDNLSRAILHDGSLKRLIAEYGVDGVTSNPSIFQKAIGGTPHYRKQIENMCTTSMTAEECYEALVIPDIQEACALLTPAYVASHGETGYVSLEISPHLAHDMKGSEAAAYRLRQAVRRNNLLIKIPATPAGILAIEHLTAAGVCINVTLIFSLAQYQAVAHAYLKGAQRWVNAGGNGSKLRSVASVFLSRVDTLTDQRLDAHGSAAAKALKGKTAVALAKRCYQAYQEYFHGPAFSALGNARVRPQSLLWASTGVKNPAYRDLLYVEPLIGLETINTLPEATLEAFRQHGIAEPTLMSGMHKASEHLKALAALRIEPEEIGETLQTEGLRQFINAYDQILSMFK